VKSDIAKLFAECDLGCQPCGKFLDFGEITFCEFSVTEFVKFAAIFRVSHLQIEIIN
jgi:hypothetical protein